MFFVLKQRWRCWAKRLHQCWISSVGFPASTLDEEERDRLQEPQIESWCAMINKPWIWFPVLSSGYSAALAMERCWTMGHWKFPELNPERNAPGLVLWRQPQAQPTEGRWTPHRADSLSRRGTTFQLLKNLRPILNWWKIPALVAAYYHGTLQYAATDD